MKTNKKEIAVIECNEATKRFNDFLDNYLKGQAREELIQHIAECRHCYERLEFEQLLKSRVAALKRDSVSLNPHAEKRIQHVLSKLP
jgi:hypothetical protein